jgi:hypothetical protein
VPVLDDTDYAIWQDSGRVNMVRVSPYRRLIAVQCKDGQWAAEPTETPMPWEVGSRQFATAAEALTALVPYAAAAGERGQEMRDLINATTFKEPK